MAAEGSIPSWYAWLRWLYPDFWNDTKFSRSVLGLFDTMENLKRSRKTVLDFFETHARDRPNHPCVLYEREMYTYAEVYRHANRTARWISGSDPSLKKGDVACVLLHNGPTFVWTWLGLQKLGVIASLINYNLKRAALLHCIQTSEAKKLIFGSEFLEKVSELMPDLSKMGVELWMINDARIPGIVPPQGVVTMEITTVSGGHYRNVPVASLGDVASFIFTSGTTGMPKPVIIPHSKTLSAAMFFNTFAGLTGDDVNYIALPMYHALALYAGVSGCFWKGATIAIAKKFSASRFWDDVRRFNVTTFQYISEICRYLLAQPKKGIDGQYKRHIKAAIGNGLGLDIWREFQTRFNIDHIYEVYGATEGNFFFINVDGHVGSVGKYPWLLKKRLDCVEIVDYTYEDSQPKRGADGLCIRLPPGKTGLMLLKITERTSFIGYKGPREMTEKKITRNVKHLGDAYFNTGDLLRIDPDGHVYFMDRLGDTFRWQGENVSTQEVSHALSSFPAILEANVYGVRVPRHDGKAGMAAIVVRDGATLDLSALYDHAASSLPKYARPMFLRRVTKMDVTDTFKHKKTELVKRGFAPDQTSEVYIIDHRRGTYVPITQELLRSIIAGHSKL